MADSKTFVLQNGVTIEKIGEHLVSWFENTKNMIAEGAPADGGYFVQAKDHEDGWKKFAGMTKALQVQLLKAENNVIVNCNFGKWSDKVGAGAVGMLLFAPLAATAAFGAVTQSKLPAEVFAEIEKYIINGGQSVVVSLGSKIKENEIICPACHSKNTKGMKYCKDCGTKLTKECLFCGADISGNTSFCPSCGKPVKSHNVCINCGAELSDKQLFCPACGTKQEKTCPKCGTIIVDETRFCPKCGSTLSGTRLCTNCNAELPDGAIFCTSCGQKAE